MLPTGITIKFIYFMKFKILIGIVTYNRKELLDRCIQYLRKQTYDDFDLLVINNGSTDGTNEYLDKFNINHINNNPAVQLSDGTL